jgi:group I intron endonuclease
MYKLSARGFTFPDKIRGVYSIRNEVNGKQYVGKAEGQKGFKGRWYIHKSDLKANKHPNQHLQNAYNKYGIENFTFNILEICDPSKVSIKEKEDEWILKLNVNDSEIGYNCISPAKLEAHFNSKRYTNESRTVYKFRSPDGEIISGKNLMQIARDLNLSSHGLRKVFYGKQYSFYGYTSTNPDFSSKPKKEYRLLSPEGLIHEFDNINEFAAKTGLSKNGLGRVLMGKQGHCGGWSLENPEPKFVETIEEFNTKISLVMDDSKIHNFATAKSIQRKYSASYSLIKNILLGKTPRDFPFKKWRVATNEDFKLLEQVEETEG